MTEKTYLTYGSMMLTLYDMTHVLLFNKNMQKNLKMDDPYKLVQNGARILDKMKEMDLAARLDNGDGVWDKADTYGIVGGYNAVMYTENVNEKICPTAMGQIFYCLEKVGE